MKKTAIVVFTFLLMVVSCGKDKETTSKPETKKESETVVVPADEKEEEPAYDFSGFEIGKEKLGPLKIGMSMAKADALLTDFTKEEAEAYDWGFDGGGKSYIYKLNGKSVMALVPDDKGNVLAIVAIDENLKTSKGLHPGMTANELFPLYPNVKVHVNQMMNWENVIDDVKGWHIVFATDEKHRIGSYKDLHTPSLPKNVSISSDWITITKPVTKTDCSILHDGVFKYRDSEGEDVTVKINADSWTEEHKGGKYITLGKLTWKNKCEYENMLLMSSLPGFKLAPGTIMNVKIDDVKGFDVYFTATAEGKSYHGKMTKV